MAVKHFKTIRLDETATTALLNRLDVADNAHRSSGNEIFYSYRTKGVVVFLHHPGSATPIPYAVPSRLLSSHHLVFLHGGFIYPKTSCQAQLITRYGTWINVEGQISRCTFVEANIHEVEVAFTRTVDPASCCADAVSCKVLLVDDDRTSVRLADLHLSQLHAQVDHAGDGLEAVEKALSNTYDVILMDLQMPKMDGITALKTLREKGYRGSVIALTASTRPEDQEQCTRVGFNGFVSKPYTKAQLAQALSGARQETILSTLEDDPAMAELIEAFATELPSTVRSLGEAISASNLTAIGEIARSLKGQGTSHGFEVITSAAQEVEDGILRGQTLDALRNSVENLIKLCSSVRTSTGVGRNTPAAQH